MPETGKKPKCIRISYINPTIRSVSKLPSFLCSPLNFLAGIFSHPTKTHISPQWVSLISSIARYCQGQTLKARPETRKGTVSNWSNSVPRQDKKNICYPEPKRQIHNVWHPLGWAGLAGMETKPLLRTNQQPDQPRTNTEARLASQQHENLYYSSISYKWRHRKGAKDPHPDFRDGCYDVWDGKTKTPWMWMTAGYNAEGSIGELKNTRIKLFKWNTDGEHDREKTERQGAGQQLQVNK